MEKFILKTTTNWINTTQEVDIDDFDSNDFERYTKGELTDSENQNYLSMAIEDQGLEWWIEKKENDD